MALDRYDVERAVKASDEPAPSRHIILTLLTHVTNGTLNVPSEHAPSLTTLAKETGLGRSTVAEHLDRLEAKGWVLRFRPPVHKAQTEGARTGYRLTVPTALAPSPGAGLVQEPDQAPSPGAGLPPSPGAGLGPENPQVEPSPGAGLGSPGAGLVQELDTVQRSSSSPTEKKNKGGAGGKRTKAEREHPAFAEWYDAYPVHKARGAAVNAYAKAVTKTEPATLLAAAKRYRNDPQVARGYAKHPATWLNQECWLDDPTPLRATGTTGPAPPRGGPRADVNEHDWSNGFSGFKPRGGPQ